jgi:hypothetical protein
MSEPEFSPKVIYQINRWSEVFETSVSRRYETLTWVSERVSFLGSGWQKGLDDHGDQWLAVYGAWMVIVRIAASNKREYRGILCGEKGEPISASRIARIPGVSTKAIQECLSWAVKVGWLVPYVPDDCQKNVDQTSTKHSPQLSEVCEKHTTGRDVTGRDVTKPNGTERDGTRDRSPARPGPVSAEEKMQLSQAVSRLVEANPQLQQLQSQRIAPDTSVPEEMIQSVFVSLKASDVLSKPPLWWAAVWYKRQLAAPDPVLRGSNAAEAAIVVALSMCLAKLPEHSIKKSRTSMFISLLTRGAAGLQTRIGPYLPSAITAVEEVLAKSAARGAS